MSERLLRRIEVERVTGYKTSSIYEGMAAGTFPRSVKINARAVGWVASEIEEFILARIAERDAKYKPVREPVDVCDTRVR